MMVPHNTAMAWEQDVVQETHHNDVVKLPASPDGPARRSQENVMAASVMQYCGNAQDPIYIELLTT